MITSDSPWNEQWAAYIGFRPNSPIEERIERLERRLRWDRSCLNSAESFLMVCGEWNPKELADTRRRVQFLQLKVERLERLIEMLEEKAEAELIDRLLPDIPVADAPRPQDEAIEEEVKVED